MLHFCVENEITLPKISGDFTGYPSVESIVLYEALRQLEPKTARFFCEDYGHTLTLDALCHFCATYGITIPCVTTKEIPNVKKSPENSPEKSADVSMEKAPSEGLLDDENRSGRTHLTSFIFFRLWELGRRGFNFSGESTGLGKKKVLPHCIKPQSSSSSLKSKTVKSLGVRSDDTPKTVHTPSRNKKTLPNACENASTNQKPYQPKARDE